MLGGYLLTKRGINGAEGQHLSPVHPRLSEHLLSYETHREQAAGAQHK